MSVEVLGAENRAGLDRVRFDAVVRTAAAAASGAVLLVDCPAVGGGRFALFGVSPRGDTRVGPYLHQLPL